MNRNAHIIAGTTASTAVYLMACDRFQIRPTGTGILKAVVVGGIGGVLPDLIEPAVSPMHRGLFHSLIAAVVIVLVLCALWQYMEQNKKEPDWGFVLGVGYTSHLALDMATPMGLPIA